ncbi:MAG TPA: hypothetical protein VN976_04240 [Verrucomicrobiae bacterium]|nr:hypothetical protein [Verrucomicrobiae bacterium]
MTTVLADLRELTRPLSAFTAFQLGHFCPRGILPFMEKDNSWAGESVGDTDLVLILAALPRLLYTHIRAKSREVRWSQWVDATLAQGLFVGVQEADFARGRQLKQNKRPV